MQTRIKGFLNLLFVVIFTTANAQSEFTIGGSAGITYNTVKRKGDNENKPLTGFVIGADFRYPLRGNFFLYSNPRFERIGSSVHDLVFTNQFGEIVGKGKALDRLHYFALPLAAGFESGKQMKFSLHAGAFVSLLTKSHIRIKFDEGGEGVTKYYDTRDTYEGFNYGLQAGAGLSFLLNKNTRGLVQLLDEYGLKNIRNNSINPGPELRTNSLMLTIGVLYSMD